jgi:hypothetical protein
VNVAGINLEDLDVTWDTLAIQDGPQEQQIELGRTTV